MLPFYSALVKHVWSAGSRSGVPSRRETWTKLQRVQQKAAKMIKRQQHLTYEERWTQLWLEKSLEKRRLGEILATCIWWQRKRIGSWAFLSGVREKTGGCGQKPKYRKSHLNTCCEGCQTLQHVAYRGYGVLILAGTKNLPRHCPERCAVVDPALSCRFGLAEVQRCPPTSVFLQFCDLPASPAPQCWCLKPSRLSHQLLGTTALGCSFLYFQKFQLPWGRW